MVITSYALLRRDIDTLREIKFSTVVLDEAQHIKNPETQNAQAAFALRAKHRFVLTGTPMENSVRDLWSIMNFAFLPQVSNAPRGDVCSMTRAVALRGTAQSLREAMSGRCVGFELVKQIRQLGTHSKRSANAARHFQ